MSRDDDEKLHNRNIFMTLLTSSFCSMSTWEVTEASRRAHVSLAINKIDEVVVGIVCGVLYCEYMERKWTTVMLTIKNVYMTTKVPLKLSRLLFFYFVGFFTWMEASAERKMLEQKKTRHVHEWKWWLNWEAKTIFYFILKCVL